MLKSSASILRSTGLSVKEISKKLKKSELWVVKWSSRNDRFEDKNRTGRPKILNEAAKTIILNKINAKFKGETRPDSFHNNWQAKAMMGEKTPSGGL